MTDNPLDQTAEQYGRAEQAYLNALASGADGPTLRNLATEVAAAAQTWDAANNAAGEPPRDVSRYYDVPEVLSTLWQDLAAAHGSRGG